jgi:hypothetical protein
VRIDSAIAQALAVNQTVVVAPAREPATAEARIRSALAQPTEFEFPEMPLTEVAHYISDRHKIPLQFDTNALRDSGIDPATTPVTRNLKGLSLRSALNLVLDELNLTWLIRDEVLLITTKDAANEILETRVYDVSDFVVSPSQPKQHDVQMESLVKTIKDAIHPGSVWSDQGGRGTINPFARENTSALVVLQTFDAHEQIANLLAELRKLTPGREAK